MATQYANADNAEKETVVGLLRRLMDDVSKLFRQELALATAEIMQSLTRILTGTASVAVGGAVLFASFLVLLASAILGLSNVVEPWLAALIIGVIVGVAGYVMMQKGIKAFDPADLRLTRSPESLRQDKEVLTRKDR